VSVHVSSNESVTLTVPSVTTDPARALTGKVNQSSAWVITSSTSSIVAKCPRSGGNPPMSTA
jgi:hypothetical protein